MKYRKIKIKLPHRSTDLLNTLCQALLLTGGSLAYTLAVMRYQTAIVAPIASFISGFACGFIGAGI